MKVIFKVIKTGSGNDVYFERLAEALKKEGVEVTIEYFSKYFQFIPSLLYFINKKSTADIIHSNVEYGWVFKEKDKPLYITLHHNVFDSRYFPFTSLAQKIFYLFVIKPNTKKTLQTANKIIAVSKYTKQSFTQTYGKYPIHVLYNFVNTNVYKPQKIISSDNRFKLLFIGNLTRRKGADLLPQIMVRLGRKFVLYYTAGLRSSIPKNFNFANMIPLGRLSENQLTRIINTSDALLFPTRFEGFGYAVVEAMACGKPVITTNTSSLPEIVTDKENGFTCTPNNIDDFVDKIIRLSQDKFLQSRISETNRKKIIENFSLEAISLEIKKIYKET